MQHPITLATEAPEQTAEESFLDEEFAPEQVYRWKVMGFIVLLLLAVIVYLYQTKVGTPIDQLEPVVSGQVITQSTNGEVTPPVLSERTEAPLASPSASASANADTQQAAGALCPEGTTRLIHIDNSPLCCQGDICHEAQ